MHLRPAVPSDLASVDALLARSYPRLLKANYPASVLVTALPRIVRAQPALLASGTYFVMEEAGAVIAAGGWTRDGPGGGRTEGTGHVRHVATDPDRLRAGLASRLMDRIAATARRGGIVRLDCLSTRTAVPFYAARGFREVEPVEVPLGPGIAFPAIRMVRPLN